MFSPCKAHEEFALTVGYDNALMLAKRCPYCQVLDGDDD